MKNQHLHPGKKVRLGVLSPIMGEGNLHPFSKQLRVLSQLSSRMLVVAVLSDSVSSHMPVVGNADIARLVHSSEKDLISRITTFIRTRLKVALLMLRHAREVDIWILYLGFAMIIPAIVARATRTKMVLVFGGNMSNEIEVKETDWLESLCHLKI
jgi:hypothetical protein